MQIIERANVRGKLLPGCVVSVSTPSSDGMFSVSRIVPGNRIIEGFMSYGEFEERPAMLCLMRDETWSDEQLGDRYELVITH